MAKHRHKQAIKKHSRSTHGKTVAYYLKFYAVLLFIGVTAVVGGKFIFQPQPLCANSGSCKSDLSEKIENGAMGMFEGHKVIPPKISFVPNSAFSVLGINTDTAPSDKHIYVDLSSQTLYAYEGANKIFQTLVSTGRWRKTPTGNFHIWEKLVSTRMTGGEGADAYDLPNVPYVMYFYNDFGLHGAYWHDNFGHTMSHGCVNLRQIDAEMLYNWTDGPKDGNLGTAVSICDQFSAPNNCVQTNPINN